MTLSPTLVSLADRLVAANLAGRDDLIRAELTRHEQAAISALTIRHTLYATQQQQRCIEELDYRVNIVWQSYRRVIVESLLPWTDGARKAVEERLEALLSDDLPRVEEMARPVIANHFHGFNLFLRDCIPRFRARMAVEMDIFELRYKPAAVAVSIQLQSPRYTSVRGHWMDSLEAIRGDPPRMKEAGREAVLALESLARLMTGSKKTLGPCIDILRSKGVLNGSSATTFHSLWGMASNLPGFRHGSTERIILSASQIQYVIDVSEASLRHLLNADGAA